MTVTGWLLIDPLISLLIAAVILFGTGCLLCDSMRLAIDSVPEGIDMPEIKRYLTGFENVSQLHDLHVRPMSTTEVELSVHLVVVNESPNNDFLPKLQKQLHERFGIGHSTMQIERQDGDPCMLDKDGCV
jgi:cobalt-zinc-cadmium efflux system protein